MALRPTPPVAGRRVLITGAARGIGAALAHRLHGRGARVALAGLEPGSLAEVAAACDDAPWWECDVADEAQVGATVEGAVDALGGLDVVVANAGVASQLPLVGGDPEVMRQHIDVNLMGAYLTLRAAGPHVSHPGGYAVAVSSLAAAVQPPLLGAYAATKAAVEALANSLRAELAPTGARVGVAYFAELDTDMTSRGFATAAADALMAGVPGRTSRVAPLEVGIDALAHGIARRSRWIVAPWWVAGIMPLRMAAQPLVERATRRRAAEASLIAREETVELTTPQPERPRG